MPSRQGLLLCLQHRQTVNGTQRLQVGLLCGFESVLCLHQLFHGLLPAFLIHGGREFLQGQLKLALSPCMGLQLAFTLGLNQALRIFNLGLFGLFFRGRTFGNVHRLQRLLGFLERCPRLGHFALLGVQKGQTSEALCGPLLPSLSQCKCLRCVLQLLALNIQCAKL